MVVADGNVLRIISNILTVGEEEEKAEKGKSKTASVTTACGFYNSLGFNDGVGDKARLNGARGLASAPWDRNIVFFTDRNVIRTVHLKSREVRCVAGKPTAPGAHKNGQCKDAQFNSPEGLCFMPQLALDGGLPPLLIADTQNNCLRLLTFTAKGEPRHVLDLANYLHKVGWRDGEAEHSRFEAPAGLAVGGPDASMAMITEAKGHRLRLLLPSQERLQAKLAYENLRRPSVELAKELSDLARRIDFGTPERALAAARAALLSGQQAATAAVFRRATSATLERISTSSTSVVDADAETTLQLLFGLTPMRLLTEVMPCMFLDSVTICVVEGQPFTIT